MCHHSSRKNSNTLGGKKRNTNNCKESMHTHTHTDILSLGNYASESTKIAPKIICCMPEKKNLD